MRAEGIPLWEYCFGFFFFNTKNYVSERWSVLFWNDPPVCLKVMNCHKSEENNVEVMYWVSDNELWFEPTGCPQMEPRTGHGLQGPLTCQLKGEQWIKAWKHLMQALTGDGVDFRGPRGPVNLPPPNFRAVPAIYQEKGMFLSLVDKRTNMFGVGGASCGRVYWESDKVSTTHPITKPGFCACLHYYMTWEFVS